MRLTIHVPDKFHARTEPWRYEDFPAPNRAERDVKVFWEYGPRKGTESWPQMTQKFDGIITDLVINVPSVHFILLYLALSRSILQSANFVAYLCNSERKMGNNPPPPLRSSPLSQEDSQLQPPSVKSCRISVILCSIHRSPLTVHFQAIFSAKTNCLLGHDKLSSLKTWFSHVPDTSFSGQSSTCLYHIRGCTEIGHTLLSSRFV